MTALKAYNPLKHSIKRFQKLKTLVNQKPHLRSLREPKLYRLISSFMLFYGEDFVENFKSNEN